MAARAKGRAAVELQGALALVTGAGSGIGRATAVALAGRGTRVLCADIDLAAAEATASTCAALTAGAVGLPVDVSAWESVDGLGKQVLADHGTLDVLVNNAGVGMSGRLLDSTIEDWEWILGINLLGVVHGCKAFGPAMVERGRGQVVNVSSGLAYTPTATEPAYGTTKAGVLALSRCLRADWASHGVGVTAVCPGVINTPIVQSTRYRGEAADPVRIAKVQRTFAKRGHPPELVAGAIVGAVERNRAVVPVGVEAKVGWYLSRFLPTAVGDRLARIELG